MSFKKPFQAAPVQLGRYQRRQSQQAGLRKTVRVLGLAAMGGATIGTGSLMLDEQRRADMVAFAKPVAVGAGLMRARAPQPGDVWGGCDDARASGTAPIYRYEPGYRETMDGDRDGIACEPVP